jgi:hypothetical protein
VRGKQGKSGRGAMGIVDDRRCHARAEQASACAVCLLGNPSDFRCGKLVNFAAPGDRKVPAEHMGRLPKAGRLEADLGKHEPSRGSSVILRLPLPRRSL